jgi:hypothetical protein
MKRKWHIGVDLGLRGALCIMTYAEDEIRLETLPMPLIKGKLDYHKLHSIIELYEGFNGHLVMEKLGVIFGSSKKTAFSMGYQAGALEAMLIARCLPYTIVQAKAWQAEMFQGVPELKKSGSKRRDTKAMALVAVQRLFPHLKLTFGTVAKVPHDGLIDAVLMAEYSRRKFQ